MTNSAAIQQRKTKKAFGIGHYIAPYAFIAPYFIIFFAFSVFPILYSAYVSTTDWDGWNPAINIGLGNYVNLFQDPIFYKALTNTLLLMLMIIPAQIFIGLSIAMMLSIKMLPFRKSFRLLNFLPFLTAPIALGMIFTILFDPNFGPINAMLSAIGIENAPNWFGRDWPARAMIAIITVWRYAGYTAVLFLAGITNINPDLYEAGEIDGANWLQRQIYIVMPMLKPVTIFVILTTMIGCFQIFEEPFMIFRAVGRVVGGPDNSVLTGMWLFYDRSFGTTMRFGYGSAIAFSLLIVIALLTFFVNRILKAGEDKH